MATTVWAWRDSEPSWSRGKKRFLSFHSGRARLVPRNRRARRLREGSREEFLVREKRKYWRVRREPLGARIRYPAGRALFRQLRGERRPNRSMKARLPAKDPCPCREGLGSNRPRLCQARRHEARKLPRRERSSHRREQNL